MGHVLHSRMSAADICDHIGNEMRKNEVKAIKDSREKIGIMIDEATTNSLKSSLVVCLRFFFCLVSPHPCCWIQLNWKNKTTKPLWTLYLVA